MKKLCSKTLETLIMNRTDQHMTEKLIARKKLFALYCTNIRKVEMLYVLHDKVALRVDVLRSKK